MGSENTQTVVLSRRLLRMCRRSMRRSKIADSSGIDMTGASLLLRTLIFRRLLRRNVLAADESNVGVLVPPSAGAVLANAALAVDRRVAINLNYTFSSKILNDFCIGPAGIRHVLTSRKVMERFQFDLDAELVYLEDFKEQITLTDKLTAAMQTWLVPIPILERQLGLHRVGADDLLTIIYTSGSTGEPKGVMLTHRNVATDMDAFSQVIHLGDDDVLVGVLPVFHSFGYTTTVWDALTLCPKGIYHFSPLEARQIGKLCRQHGGTILISTPTFLRPYLRQVDPEDFASLQVVITGAEQLPPDLADSFEERFGVRPVEGYGTTELAPVVSCNIPPGRERPHMQHGRKEGTVGQPIPGVSAKITDVDSGEPLEPGQAGMLWIKGPNVMKGYYQMPEKTAEVLADGWYMTGDIALIDEEGFIRITGRESRFSKIGGEMVPHIRIEQAIAEILQLSAEELSVAVTAVPHATKGERLVVFHTALNRSPEEICRGLADAGLPPIWIPSPDGFCQVSEIPIMGTGKLDLRGLKEQALQKFGDNA